MDTLLDLPVDKGTLLQAYQAVQDGRLPETEAEVHDLYAAYFQSCATVATTLKVNDRAGFVDARVQTFVSATSACG